VVTRYEKGIAFVRVWEEFADEHGVAVGRSNGFSRIEEELWNSA